MSERERERLVAEKKANTNQLVFRMGQQGDFHGYQSAGPELFPGIGILPGPATGSHIVKRETPVAPLGQPQLNVPREDEPPGWEAPGAQVFQQAPSPQGHGRLTSG